ncbi:hypothetical protein M2138_000749 [Dysgonomonadaceae bacterium PH5-43]|nr:hypothetical protein [Dysgonomonadaceae bacterium PH5-43]
MKLVTVAVFTFPNDASVLESILLSEKIEYYLNNQGSSIIVPGTGTTLTVKEDDVPRVVNLIKEAGFENNLIN